MKILIIIFLFFSCAYNAQKDLLTNFTPKSPEVSSIGEYLDKPISLSTGSVSVNIPLFNLKIDNNMSFPITLNYNTSGIRVNEIPGMAGLGWNVSAGGNITREIRGKRDDVTSPLSFKSNIDTILDYISQPEMQLHNWMEMYSDRDTEPDEYNVVIFDESFKFYYDYNSDKFIAAPINDYKIEPVASSNIGIEGFKITNSQGFVFYFGGSPELPPIPNLGQNPVLDRVIDQGGITYDEDLNQTISPEWEIQSWMLVGIKTPNNKMVRITYQEARPSVYIPDQISHTGQYMYIANTADFYGEINRYSIVSIVDNTVKVLGSVYPITHNIVNNIQKYATPLNTFYKSRTNDLHIKSILFENYTVDFEHSSSLRKEIDEYCLSKVKLSIDNSPIKEYQFVTSNFNDDIPIGSGMYDYSRGELGFFSSYFEKSKYRLRLDKIIEKFPNENDVNKMKVYSFEYFPGELPSKLSFAQDYWGGYNGRTDNKNLIPVQNVPFYQGNTTVRGNADRYPNIDFAKIGMLKRINYPTKGSLEINYENHTYENIYDIDEIPNAQAQLLKRKINANFGGDFGVDIDTQELILEDRYEFPFEIVSNNSQFFVNQCTIATTSGTPNSASPLDGYVVTLRKEDGTILKYFNNSSAGDQYILSKGLYKLIAIRQNYNDPLEFFLSFSYFDELRNPSQDNISNPNKIAGGLRIKSLTHKDNNENILLKTEYSYKEENGANSGLLHGYPIWRINEYYKDLHKLYGIISFPFRPSSGSFVTYSRVVEDNINYLTNDKISTVHIFEKYPEVQITNSNIESRMRSQNLTWKNFRKQSSSFFKNGLGDKVKSDSVEYNYNSPKLIENYGVRLEARDKFFIATIGGSPIYMQQYKHEIYPLYTDFSFIANQTTKDYFATGNVKSSKKNLYESNLHHQLLSEELETSDGSKTETTYQYAHEKNNQYLIDKNMIGIPLQTTVKKTANAAGATAKTISDTTIDYPVSQADANNRTSGLAVPYQVLSKDLQGASNTEVEYTKYDPLNGNLQEYKIKGLTPVAIIWGYNNTQPIAKVEGATYAQALAAAGSIISLSDDDAQAGKNNDETTLLNALDSFRNNTALANFQVSTYTYDPLIGVRTITPPSGIREYYLYDTANRLQSVKDANGNILKEYQYNYKH